MPKSDPKDYLPVARYQEVLDVFHAMTGTLLLEFARESRVARDTIIRNFIARADTMTRAVFRLWELEDYQDCWILHRCLLERLFHLWHLERNNQFELFEAWSFLEQYNAINRVRSDSEFSGALESKLFDLTAEQRERARALAIAPPIWQRPKAEEVARSLNMLFLYRFGYDFASTHVHPMANDGQQDFYAITRLAQAQDFPDQRSVLSNTLLVATMIVQQGLNASTLSWRALVYDFIDDLRRFLDTGIETYKISFIKLGAMVNQGIRLCQAGANPEGASGTPMQ